MITKEIARLIHNCYTEIEQGENIIIELKKSLNEKGEFELKDSWGESRGLELRIPTSSSGFSVRNVPFQLALDVIRLHTEAQQKELERLKDVCRVLLA